MPYSRTPCDDDLLAGHRALDVAAALGGQVDGDRAGRHTGEHVAGDQQRGRPPGHRGGGDQDVGPRDVRRQRLLLPYGAVLRQLARVAAGALDHVEAEVEEPGPHRLHLVGRGGPHVVGLDDGAEPARGGDRLQARDPGAEHQDLGRRDGARGGHEQREEPRQPHRRLEGAPVAGDERLGGQRVHRLGPRDARDELHGQRRHPGRLQGADAVQLAGPGDEPDGDRARAQPGHLGRQQRPDVRHQVGALQHVTAEHVGTGRAVVVVGGQGSLARSGLDAHLVALPDQERDRLRRQGDPPLTRPRLGRNADQHDPNLGDAGGRRAVPAWIGCARRLA